MTRNATQEERWDRERDYRKHDGPRPHDKDPLPLHVQSPPIAGALEVAILVKAVSLTDGAALIEQYARTVASEAALQATVDAGDRILAQIGSPDA